MNPSDEIASNYTLTAPSFVSETNVGERFIISDFMSRLLGTEEATAEQVPEASPSTDTTAEEASPYTDTDTAAD